MTAMMIDDRPVQVDVCSGIGGFPLAGEWAGFRPALFCEIDAYCRRVLAKHWPEVPCAPNLFTLTGDLVREHVAFDYTDTSDVSDAECTEWRQDDTGFLRGEGRDGRQAERHEGTTRLAERSQVDLLTGGIPCQPFSLAGRQRGADDSRHLWPQMLRLTQELRPAWVCIENVSGFVRMALDDVCLDLETAGYQVQPLVFPACGVGAWHKRERVFIIAHDANAARLRGAAIERHEPHGDVSGNADAANTAGRGLRRGETSGQTGLAARLYQDVPDADGERQLQPCGLVRDERRWSGDLCADVPDAEQRRRGERGEPSGGGHAQETALSRTDAAHPWLGWDGRRPLDTIWDGEPQCGLGGVAARLPSGLDFTGRLAAKQPNRVNRLKALGNSVSPEQTYPVLAAIREAL